MPTLPIILVPDPVLREKAAPIERFTPALRDLAQDMLATMVEGGGVGLAGPQVGVRERIFVMRVRPDDTRVAPDHPLLGKGLVLINPVLVETSAEKEEGMEGCLSIPGYAGLVMRHQRVVVQARNEWGKATRYEVDGYLARIMQHEMDHLDGILFLDRLEGEKKLFKVVEEDDDAQAPDPTL